MRKLVSVGLAVALVLTFTGAAFAAKGGGGGGNGGGAGGGGVAGLPTISTIQLNQAGPFKFGDVVTFTTSAVGLRGGEYPLVYVECDAADGSVLYGQLDYPNAAFVLGGGSSPWWLVGGDAVCNAGLFSYGGKTDYKLAELPMPFVATWR
jgi:hypothetical protein